MAANRPGIRQAQGDIDMPGRKVRWSRVRVAETLACQQTAAPADNAPPWRRMAGTALLTLSLVACSQPGTVTPTQTPAGAAQAVAPKSAPCIKRVPKPYQWEGYNDKLVDACIGPTHYRFPANLFRDQMGPDFQANFGLVLLWPDLQAAPPGKLNIPPLVHAPNWIRISPYYVDRVPIETLLERSASKKAFEADDDPSILALRDRQPDRYGLTPYFVNPEQFRAFHTAQAQRFGHKSRAKLENEQDWYLHRGIDGRLTTLIKCDSRLEPDGYMAKGRALVKIPGIRTNALCTHHLVIGDVKTSVRISYPRALLKEWKRFEDRARELFETHRVR
ncbi:MAG: hypothetical protein R3E94_02985 [Burkholderiaceae bacterium]